MPGTVVEGVGAKGLPTPPVGTLYQSRLLPVAVSCAAGSFWQYTIEPITPGVPGDWLAVTANVCAALLPQALLAVTVIVPDVFTVVTVIVFVVLVPIHPPGNVQV